MPRLRNTLLSRLVLLCLTETASGQQPAAVVVAPVEKKPINLASQLVATMEPMVRSMLAADQAALVRERHFDEGQEVQEGDLLAKFDDSLLQRRLASLQAQQRSAEAELLGARLSEENASRERDRVTRLYEQSGANEEEYYDAINAHEQSQAAIAVAEALVRSEERRVGKGGRW